MEPIVIDDIWQVRIGDTLRSTEMCGDLVFTRTIMVARIVPRSSNNPHGVAFSEGGWAINFGYPDWTYEVIERREPLWKDAKLDSLWRDDETDTLWRRMVNLTGDDYVRFAQVSGEAVEYGWLTPENHLGDREIADRLVPAEQEGVSPWLWDPETKTAWVAVSDWVTVSDEPTTHLQVGGKLTNMGYLVSTDDYDSELAARLIPYAEREQ